MIGEELENVEIFLVVGADLAMCDRENS